ncbi:hypothetical protein CEXT_484101 [Caerostris extrusa]|uniref:Uncharacterized protein n=1 Tax=Caerostris extrusa TaxID=172846 RepID=A0AAV4NYL0_CAEEX|nr:hypothetical protein CEXT_484101 [Caerostris extrusa]
MAFYGFGKPGRHESKPILHYLIWRCQRGICKRRRWDGGGIDEGLPLLPRIEGGFPPDDPGREFGVNGSVAGKKFRWMALSNRLFIPTEEKKVFLFYFYYRKWPGSYCRSRKMLLVI